MLKRVSSMVIAIVMLLAMVCIVPVSAATADVTVSVTVDKEEAERGETIVATLALLNHKPMNCLEINGTYDENILLDAVFASAVNAGQLQVNVQNGTFEIAWANAEITAAEKTVLGTLTFKVRSAGAVSEVGADVIASITATIVDAAYIAGDGSGMVVTPLVPGEAAQEDAKIVCDHDFTGTVIDLNNGTHKGTCTLCGKEVTDYCRYGAGVPVDATHTEKAHTLYTCTDCGYGLKENFVGETLPHTDWVYAGNGTHKDACCGGVTVEPCTFPKENADGSTCYLPCLKCGEVQKNTAVHVTHSAVEHYYAPSATKPGKIQFQCGACDVVNTNYPIKNLAAGHPYADVTNADLWYYDEVTFNNAYGIFKGDLQGNFNPDGNITRAQAAIVFSRMILDELNYTEDQMNGLTKAQFEDLLKNVAGYSVATKEVTLTDVSGLYYERNAVLMSTLGIVTGYLDGSFGGEGLITREQLAAMMERVVAVIENINGETYDSFGTPVAAYTDAASVSEWAAANVEWVRTTGLMNGDTYGNFNPQGNATRAQIAALMMRLRVEINSIVVH